MFSIQQPLLVFSDLDGTLLDSHSYDWQPAAPWLSRLREANVPVILCSSKTSAEMLYLQKTLGLQGLPLIAENGAVIQLAEQWPKIILRAIGNACVIAGICKFVNGNPTSHATKSPISAPIIPKSK